MSIILGYLITIGLLKLTLPSKKLNNLYLIFIMILLFFIGSMRSIYFGTDTIGYINTYKNLSNISLSYYINSFYNGNIKDPFFYLFSKILNLVGLNYRVWLSILFGIYIYALYKFIKKYSPYPVLSITVFISLGYLYFSFTGLRQTLALSIILLSYNYIRERNLLLFIMFVFIASLFHSTALVFLLIYPISHYELGKIDLILIIVMLIVSFFLSSFIRNSIFLLGWSNNLIAYATSETSLNYSGLIIQLSIYFFCLISKKKVLEESQKNITLYNLILFGIIFQIFATEIAEFFRVSMYFSIFSIVLIPKTIAVLENRKERIVVYFLVIITLLIYIVLTDSFSDFQFYWNDNILLMR